jgi:hypothetical protein
VARAAAVGQTQTGVLQAALLEFVSGGIYAGATSGARTPGYAGQRFY